MYVFFFGGVGFVLDFDVFVFVFVWVNEFDGVVGVFDCLVGFVGFEGCEGVVVE